MGIISSEWEPRQSGTISRTPYRRVGVTAWMLVTYEPEINQLDTQQLFRHIYILSNRLFAIVATKLPCIPA